MNKNALIPALLLACTACSQVEFNTEVRQTPYSSCSFSYDWGKAATPDTMRVYMSRLIHARHYLLTLDPQGQPLDTVAMTAETDSLAPDSLTQQEGDFVDRRFILQPGKYIATTVSALGPGLTVTGQDAFATDKSINITHMELHAEKLADAEVDSLFNFDSLYSHFQWKGLNSIQQCIRPLPGKVYVASQRGIHTVRNQVANVKFKPRNLVQTLYFPFTIQVEDGISIDKVLVQLSGITDRVNLSTACSTPDSLYRVVFAPHRCDTLPNDEQFRVYQYQAQTNILGLYSPKNVWQQPGPGLIHLIVYLKYKVKGSEENKYKIVYASKNLHDYIAKSNLLRYNPQEEGYTITRDSAKLQLDYTFKISINKLQEVNDGGIIDWEAGEDIEGEL